MKHTCLSIKVEVDPGSDIKQAAKDAMNLANKLNVTIDFLFNGVTCLAIPGGDDKNIPINYFKAIGSKSPYKFATSHEK